MINERIIELINAGIDGELNEADAAELQEALAKSPEARSLQTDMQALTTLISDLPPRQPPDNLRRRILEKVNLPARRNWTFRHLKLPEFAGYGLAVAAGLVMIVGIYQFGPRNATPEDISRMTGTISTQKPAGEMALLDNFSLESDAVSGSVSLQSRGDEFIVDFDLNSSTAVDVLVKFTDQGLQFSGIEQIEGELATAEVSEGSVWLSTTGNQQFGVHLKRLDNSSAGDPVSLTTEFFSTGARVHQGILNSQ